MTQESEGSSKVCECCGAKLVEYRFTFNHGLAVFLRRLFNTGGKPARTDDLGLTYAQRTNSQKLRYWGLAEPVISPDTARRRGWWQITEKGRQFVLGAITIPRHAITKRNVVQRLEGDAITFAKVCEGYELRGDYADQAREQLQRSE
jgi:hypothetical protein